MVFSIGDDCREMYIKTSTSVKSLLSNYADECDLPLRSLRFSLNGRTLFLSSLGRKTAKDLNITHLDEITVTSIRESSHEANPEPICHVTHPSKSKKKCSNIMNSRKKKRNKPTANNKPRTLALDEIGNKLKESHSIALTKIFEEAEPIFKTIRQRLNNLTLGLGCDC